MFSICNISTILSYISLSYIISSIYYLVITQKYGTPFKDAINKIPRLKQLKKDSSSKRKNIFYQGIILSIVIIYIIHPFKKCFN